MNTVTIRKTIWYAGVLCKFEVEVETIDLAQYWIDYYKRLGYKSCSLHENGKHQIYVELKEETRSTPCPQCGDRMFPSIFEPTQNYCVMCNQNYPREEI